MIKFENIGVKFPHKGHVVEAVKNVSFNINRGEIFGIVGTSGAGKSTLLRTVNLLQKPTSGKVYVDGKDITELKGEDLRRERVGIGMIFQQFNLINTKTIFENIAFALKIAGKTKEEINKRVPEVLELVGLSDKASAYPGTLSGGQKQRIGIARAIANNPRILLCDEPTSALDLQTTDSILTLLKEINQKLGITIVIITHEMEVVKKICNRVAVMKDGYLLELNDVFPLFASPEHPFTKSLVNHTLNLDLPSRLLSDKKTLKIIYNGDHAEESILSDASKKFDVDINILHGKIEYISEKPLGVLLVQLSGNDDVVEKTERYLEEKTYKIEEVI